MARDNTNENQERIALQLDERKPVFVDEKGQIHDAEKLGQEDAHERGPLTQMKLTTWYCERKGKGL